MSENYVCSATFKKEETGEYYVEFPDLEGCVTFGRTLEEAMTKAEDACAGWLLLAKKNKINIPKPNLDDDRFQNLFLIDLTSYIRKADNKAVKKNLTLPSWLCERADEKNINYSKVLQDALKSVLEVDEYNL